MKEVSLLVVFANIVVKIENRHGLHCPAWLLQSEYLCALSFGLEIFLLCGLEGIIGGDFQQVGP